MKGLWKFLTGLVLGASIGWASGYLRFPAVEGNSPFWTGFLTCLACFLSFFAIVRIFNSRKSGSRLPSSPIRRRPAAYLVAASLVLALGAAAFGMMTSRQNQTLNIHLEKQAQTIENQAQIVDSVQQNRLAVLMAGVLAAVEEDLKNNAGDTLSESTVRRVADMSRFLKPYRYHEGDSLSERKLSPERGFFLLSLAAMEIDSVSFEKIRRRSTFAFADLHGADLNALNLSYLDLQEANLVEAGLKMTNLEAANLTKADLWGAKLDSANLQGTLLRRADLSWTELNGADLKMANLNGAVLVSAKLRHADLRDATVQWADLGKSLLQNANLSCTDFLGTNLAMSNLSNTNLAEANLMAANLTDSRLKNADLYRVRCGKDLLENLSKWRVPEASELQAAFRIVDDTARKYVSAVYRLESQAK